MIINQIGGASCPFIQISWLWYAVSVIVVFAFGALWYGKFFTQQWLKAVEYKCKCGADMAAGEKCTCGKADNSFTMIFQLVSTALIGLMYFILPLFYSVVVVISISAWMKSTLKFRIAEWKRFVTLAAIDVGYFFIASIIFMLFAMI